VRIRNDWARLWVFTVSATVALILFVLLACSKSPSNSVINPVQTAVYLAWLPHPETVTAYRIYYGPTLDNMKAIRDVPAPQTEAVFDSISELHATTGQLCFRLTAINADGESPMTEGVCVTTP